VTCLHSFAAVVATPAADSVAAPAAAKLSGSCEAEILLIVSDDVTLAEAIRSTPESETGDDSVDFGGA
jgi:hypothetical protein